MSRLEQEPSKRDKEIKPFELARAIGGIVAAAPIDDVGQGYRFSTVELAEVLEGHATPNSAKLKSDLSKVAEWMHKAFADSANEGLTNENGLVK